MLYVIGCYQRNAYPIPPLPPRSDYRGQAGRIGADQDQIITPPAGSGVCTKWAEEFFSRMRRAEIGHHHHIAGPYLLRYSQEASWREDNRRVPNGDQTQRLAALAMKRKASVDFTGYWQRHIAH